MDNADFIRDEDEIFRDIDSIRVPTEKTELFDFEDEEEEEEEEEEDEEEEEKEEEYSPQKPKRKLKLFTIIIGIFLLSFVLVLAISYSKYKQDKPIDINLDNIDGLDLEGKDLSNSEDLVGIIEQAKQLQDLSDGRVNPRFRIYYQGVEVSYLDHAGNIGGVGNLTLNDTGYGFFSYLGDSVNKITTGWFENLWVSGGVNSTNVTTSKICYDGNCYTPAELNITIPDTDTNETDRFNNLTGTDCGGGYLVIGVNDNGTVVCSADTGGTETDPLWTANQSLYIQNNTADWYLNITKLTTTMFHTLTSDFEWTVTDDGSDMFMDFSEIGGVNSFFLETAGTFLEMIANPGPSNDYEMFAFEETQGADTAINFYEGGVGHNRIWNSGSMRIGGEKSSLCSNLTSDVDCDTAGTGADLVVQDDGWFGGKLFSSDWSNVSIEESQISDFQVYYLKSNPFSFYNSTNPQPGANSSFNQSLTDTLYRAQDWDNITGIPTATPSDGDTAHFSLADEIYDWVIGLAYTTETYVDDLIASVGNWSDDKGDYSTTAEAGALYSTIDEPLWTANETNVAFTNAAEVFTENITMEGIKLEGDTTNHVMYDNATCVIIKGDTSIFEIC